MIPKAHRLVLSSKNPFVGRKISTRFFTLIIHPEQSRRTEPQWAVRISKRIDKRATVRNKLRRQISQWIYRNRVELKPQQTLIILRRKPTELDLLTLFLELENVLFTQRSNDQSS